MNEELEAKVLSQLLATLASMQEANAEIVKTMRQDRESGFAKAFAGKCTAETAADFSKAYADERRAQMRLNELDIKKREIEVMRIEREEAITAKHGLLMADQRGYGHVRIDPTTYEVILPVPGGGK